MDLPPASQPLYLDCAPDAAFATLHRPRPGAERSTAVLICPPFGWDEFCAYRSLRFWAGDLAGAGYAALRVGLPGTGDSGGGPRDGDRVGAWTAAVAAAATWLRAETAARRIAAIGIGLGGALAWVAAADGAPIDDLVLWATPARGRALVRQQRAFATLERSQIYPGSEPPPAPAGELEAGGFVLSADTVARLEAIDLTSTPLPGAERRRVLLLGRDGLAVDAGLREQLQADGAVVSTADGAGFADMTSHPQLARAPLAVIAAVREWLAQDAAALPGAPQDAAAPGAAVRRGSPHDAAPDAPAAAGQPAVAALASAIMAVGQGNDSRVRETPVTIERPDGRLRAILTEPLTAPDHGLCAVLLNPGAGRRIGPNRMWVEAARRWAGGGVPTLRLDVQAIGDADGDQTPHRDDAALYAEQFVPDVLAAMQWLRERGVGERFALGGLCSGAYWSLHAGLADPGAGAVLLINPRALVWDAQLGPARDFRALLSQPFSPAKIARLATGERLRSFIRWAVAAPGRWLARVLTGHSPTETTEHELDALLDRLVASGKRTLFLFAEHEPVDAELQRSGRAQRLGAAPNVRFERVAVRDHTLRPVWAQREAHAVLDAFIARELQIAGDGRRETRAPAPAPAASPKLTA
ncbi:MAG: CocE/NonD family hydrolase [Solirubrobacteraceae bacterium]